MVLLYPFCKLVIVLQKHYKESGASQQDQSWAKKQEKKCAITCIILHAQNVPYLPKQQK